MGSIFEGQYLIGSRETDLFNMCRPSALLGLLQSAATSHSQMLNVSRDEMVGKHKAIWMLVRIKYTLFRPLRGQEVVTVRTWHREIKGASMYRDFDLEVNGERVGEAVSVWVVASAETHSLLRISLLLPDCKETAEANCKNETLSRVKIPKGLVVADTRKMQYSDTDINGHVNNVRYADIACDAIHLETMEGEFPKNMQINYSAECRPGETINLSVGSQDNKWFVHGTDQNGKARFDVSVEMAELG